MRTVHPASHNFLNIDEIIASQDRIPCEFETIIPHLGYIDPSIDSEDIPKGYQLELPFWLCKSLLKSRQPIITMQLPMIYRVSYRDMMEANPCVVDLRKMCAYYYFVGSNLIGLRRFNDSFDMAHSLLQTFQSRLIRIMDTCQNSVTTVTIRNADIACRLDLMERDLFVQGQRTIATINEWLSENNASRVRMSTLVSSYHKRKRQDSDENDDT